MLTTKSVNDIQLAYINNDSYYDMAIACANGGGIKIMYGVNGVSFTNGPVLDSGYSYNKVRIADMNSDGFPDIVGTNVEKGGIHIWYNDGKGNFTASKSLKPWCGFLWSRHCRH